MLDIDEILEEKAVLALFVISWLQPADTASSRKQIHKSCGSCGKSSQESTDLDALYNLYNWITALSTSCPHTVDLRHKQPRNDAHVQIP
jgi:hypothetical protein